MDIENPSLEMPTRLDVWQLPRRFDAVTWFVRIQREDPRLLSKVRFFIPAAGPSLLQVRNNTKSIQQQLGFTGETLLESGLFPWHGHDAYLENLGHWMSRHPTDWPATASLTWILCLHRDAWLVVASTWLLAANTSWSVKSAWLTLSLASADHDLLALTPDEAYNNLHAQVYADETARCLLWLEAHRPQDLRSWLEILSKRSFFKAIWSRLSIEHRSRWIQQLGDFFFND